MRKLWISVIVVVVIIAAVLIITQTKKEPEELKIGWIGVLSGDYAYYGESVKRGTDIALDEINKEGGINGKKLVIIYEDDQLQPKLGVAALQKFISIDKVPAVIQAAGSSVMLAEAPIAEKNEVVLISPTCSSDKISDAGDYIFRNFPRDSYQGKIIAIFAYKELNVKKAAILYINNDAGIGLKDVFQKKFHELGGKVIIIESFEPESHDLRTQIRKIMKSDVEFVFLPSHISEAAIALRQAKELNLTIPFMATDGCFSPDLIKIAGNAAEGFYVSNLAWSADDSMPRIQNFVNQYREKYDEDPSAYSAAAYDCVKILAKAMEMNGFTGPEIKEGLYAIKNFQGITGSTTFDDKGDVQKAYNIFTVKEGTFKLILANIVAE